MTDHRPIIIMPEEIAKELYSICDDNLGVFITKENIDRLQFLLQRCLANHEITDLKVKLDPNISLVDIKFIPIGMSIEEWNRKHATSPEREPIDFSNIVYTTESEASWKDLNVHRRASGKRFWIADYHFGHNKSFIYTSRGFTSIKEHDEEMIRRFNSKVGPNDTTYHIGDFCWMSVNRYLSRLNGKLIFIYGNHDKTLREFLTAHPERAEAHEGYYNMYIGNKQPLTLCHFAMHSWEKSHYNAMHVYGHHHSKTDFGGKTLNVTVDSLGGYPISENELLAYMEKRPNNWDYLGDKK